MSELALFHFASLNLLILEEIYQKDEVLTVTGCHSKVTTISEPQLKQIPKDRSGRRIIVLRENQIEGEEENNLAADKGNHFDGMIVQR